MQILIYGLSDGLVIALLALAVALVHIPARLIMLALAGVHALAPFVAWQLLADGTPVWLAMASAVLAAAALSLLTDVGNYRPLAARGASTQAQIVSGLGLYIVITQAIAMAWTSDALLLWPGIGRTWHAGRLSVTQSQLWICAVSPIAIGLLFLWLYRSRIGLAFRAMAENPRELALRGQNTDRLRTIAFSLAGAMAALAALLSANDVGFDANSSLHALLLALVAVIVGGRGSFAGVVLAALLLGTLRAAVSWWWAAAWQDAATFLLLMAALLWRPQGLLGRRTRLEVSP